jgi:hypothetical protein
LDWSADWGDVLKHMAQRLEWTDERFNLQVRLLGPVFAVCCAGMSSHHGAVP